MRRCGICAGDASLGERRGRAQGISVYRRISSGWHHSRLDLRARRRSAGEARLDAAGHEHHVRAIHVDGGSAAIEMELNALVNYRDFHASTHAGDWRMSVDPVEHGVRVVAFDWAAPFYLKRDR